MRKTSEIESELSKSEAFKDLYFHYDLKQLKEVIQPALLQVLNGFDRVCQENNIFYVITGGTLLGAVREKGFIAWDDDIDVLVWAKDIKQIQAAIVKSGLQQEYQYILPQESTGITVDAKFVSKRLTLGGLFGDPAIGHNLYLDVLPIENVPNNRFLRNIKAILSDCLFLSFSSLRCTRENDELLHVMAKDSPELRKNLLLRNIAAIPARLLGKRRTLLILEKINHCADDHSKMVSVPLGVLRYKGETIPRVTFEDSIPIEFENNMFAAPKGWDVYLHNRYGDYINEKMIGKISHALKKKCYAKTIDLSGEVTLGTGWTS